MQPRRFDLGSHSFAADPSGLLCWPDQGLAVVSDLHLEKGSAFAARGCLLPPYDTAATLDRLEAALNRLAPATVLCLGDSLHDAEAPARMSAPDRARLAALTARHRWIWIAGNHDPEPPRGWGGSRAAAVEINGVQFRHQAEAESAAVDGPVEISGHFHPVAAVRVRGRRLRARCFAGRGRRLILPAFGSFAGGLNVLDPALGWLLGPAPLVLMLGDGAVHAMPAPRLIPDRPD